MAKESTKTSHLSSSRVVDISPARRPDTALQGFEHLFETVDGVRLHYVEGGASDGPVVVLLAGFPESWFAWRKVIPLLVGNFRVIALDLPGQGDSDRPLQGYDTKALSLTLHGLLHQLKITRYSLAAHDVGAWLPSLTHPFLATNCKAWRCWTPAFPVSLCRRLCRPRRTRRGGLGTLPFTPFRIYPRS
jgi:alpha-beta hydrolase superfamily lysophospholipase